MNDLFSLAVDDSEEDPDMRRWFAEPVNYEGLPSPVTRSTAYALHALEYREWDKLSQVSQLPRAAISPGKRIMTAAEAQSFLAGAAQKHKTYSRDV